MSTAPWPFFNLAEELQCYRTDNKSTGDNRFSVRATGGVDFFISTGNCNFYPGATMWTCSSDRNLKENFAALDARRVLRHFSAKPVNALELQGSSGKAAHWAGGAGFSFGVRSQRSA